MLGLKRRRDTLNVLNIFHERILVPEIGQIVRVRQRLYLVEGLVPDLGRKILRSSNSPALKMTRRGNNWASYGNANWTRQS